MARRCAVTGKGVMVGNNVSHAMNHSKRRFLPNLQKVSVWSDSLGQAFRLRVTPHGIRTLEHKGGLDAYVLATAKTKLTPELQEIKKLVEAAAS
ncbi:MAG: 50S ribosomal protein L28 [Alphaproteobacteria bacterium]